MPEKISLSRRSGMTIILGRMSVINITNIQIRSQLITTAAPPCFILPITAACANPA